MHQPSTIPIAFGQCIVFACISFAAADRMVAGTFEEINSQALQELRSGLQNESFSVKMQAAELLIDLSYTQDVKAAFEAELKLWSEKPNDRIPAWFILAKQAVRPADREYYLDKLWKVSSDPNSSDHILATKALAQLKCTIREQEKSVIKAAAHELSAEVAYRRWLLATSGTPEDLLWLADLLKSEIPQVRSDAAYALRHLATKLPAKVTEELEKAANSEAESSCRVYLISAAFCTAPNSTKEQHFKDILLPYAHDQNTELKIEVVNALAARGAEDDVALLNKLLNDSEPAVRLSAANAILRINRRQPLTFKALDWIVLAFYGISMMCVGWFYSRVKNVEEYLLGGRDMKPWTVGISLFATLMSTLTYLAVPGEMIRHGPMILGGILSYPLVYLIVSRFIIPSFMKLRVTSAYEILEQRFGLSVRMLGSSLFLSLRLLWMALIVYATASTVLVPLLRLDPSTTPWICAVMAIVTITYTSMGGLQAVVFTDVLQTFIMLAGALLSILIITAKLGGIIAWWPTSWAPQWDTPRFFFSTDSRVALGLVILSTLTWYVSTVGSDQMAIQRYLATRDVKAARTMFGISLWCDAVVGTLLAILGLALFAYFDKYPAMLSDGETIHSNADKLLPQFIVKVLPAGIGGLVVAGILSAAMDSLSSGVNSSCSVITVDWLDRFRRKKLHGQQHVREAKVISWLVGLAVVLLSLFASIVEGNLLEKCYTVVNLFTAPLFVLFVLAMFIPWATVFGTWMGAVGSIAIAIAMAYGELFGLSFLWLTPVSLFVGIVVGCLSSLIPIGNRRPMLNICSNGQSD